MLDVKNFGLCRSGEGVRDRDGPAPPLAIVLEAANNSAKVFGDETG